jgi:hypothetical protein
MTPKNEALESRHFNRPLPLFSKGLRKNDGNQGRSEKVAEATPEGLLSKPTNEDEESRHFNRPLPFELRIG